MMETTLLSSQSLPSSVQDIDIMQLGMWINAVTRHQRILVGLGWCRQHQQLVILCLLLAGSGSFQCHHSFSLSWLLISLWGRRGLSCSHHTVTFHRHQTRPSVVCPPVAENCPQWLQRSPQFRVWDARFLCGYTVGLMLHWLFLLIMGLNFQQEGICFVLFFFHNLYFTVPEIAATHVWTW